MGYSPRNRKESGMTEGLSTRNCEASQVALVVRTCLPVQEIQEMWVLFLGWEDSLEEGMATHSSTLAWRIPMDRGTWWATVYGFTKSQTRLSD